MCVARSAPSAWASTASSPAWVTRTCAPARSTANDSGQVGVASQNRTTSVTSAGSPDPCIRSASDRSGACASRPAASTARLAPGLRLEALVGRHDPASGPHHVELGDHLSPRRPGRRGAVPVGPLNQLGQPPQRHADVAGRLRVARIPRLRVAFLSGIHCEDVSEGYQRPPGLKRAGCWNQSDIDVLIGIDGGVDVLLTHDWPMLDAAAVPGRPIRFNRGNDLISELLGLLAPSLHACGHHHRSARVQVGVTRVVALPTVASGPECLALFQVDRERSFTEVELIHDSGRR